MVFLVVVGAVLLLNSAYLAASAAPTLWFYANVGLHVVLGAVAAVGFGVYALRRRLRLDGALTGASAALVAAAVAGFWLTAVGATRAHQTALYAHAGLAAVGVLLIAAWL